MIEDQPELLALIAQHGKRAVLAELVEFEASVTTEMAGLFADLDDLADNPAEEAFIEQRRAELEAQLATLRLMISELQ